jgi:hypothetical protein
MPVPPRPPAAETTTAGRSPGAGPPAPDPDLAGLAQRFEEFAASAARDGAPLYAHLCRGIAGRRDLLALAGTSPPDQRRPNLLLAAVHFLLLKGAPHPLARHYPTVRALRNEPVVGPDGVGDLGAGAAGDDPFALFADFCHRYRAEVTDLLGARATQTNEVGRCAFLLPGLATAWRASRRPLALLDLGASAGLNLLFDRYRYDYRPGGPVGDPTSAVVLECEVRAGALPAPVLPPVVHRAGLDLRPLDPVVEDDGLWLLACQWPDHLPRFERLHRALATARAMPDRPRLSRGDMVDDLPALVGSAPPGAAVCIFHSWVAAYLTETRQRALTATVERLGRQRPLWWLFGEEPDGVAGLPVPPAPAGLGHRGATALVLVAAGRTGSRARRLADVHPHGRWLRWWDAPTPALAGPPAAAR